MTSIGSILECLKSGETIAYPTEGVWGLGCDPTNNEAIKKLLDLKGRTKDKGLILIGSKFEHFIDFAYVEDYKNKLMTKWPGPHTWLVPPKKDISDYIIGSNDKVALRLTDHDLVCSICDSFKGPIVSTSANKEGLPTLNNPQEILANFPDVKCLEGSLGGHHKPSTIQDVVTDIVIR
tara:strand:- start:1077 stop:1610 length:534 start_codon:yes stop_codon:yes gene_type:complete